MNESPEKSTIMIVDDTPANLNLLQKMLEGNGYRVLAFPSGRLALNAAARNAPDIILLDINMPEMNGYEVCERLKADEKLRDIPVIFISALSDTAAIVQAFSLGGVDYVSKPFQFEEVQARVKTQLNLCSARRALKRQNEILQDNIRLHEVVEQISRHDLKGPMTALINVPEMLINGGNLLPEQIQLLGFLSDSASRLLEMINRPLDIYKMELGSYKLTPIQVDVIKIVRKVFRELESLANRKNLKLVTLLEQKIAADNAVCEMTGENSLFFFMLSNLVKNAIEASPENQEIVVSFFTKPSHFFTIWNHGSIPVQVRERFSQRYVTFGKERGTGLGVYSARLMAKTLGGDISYTTNDVDGTTLIFSMPHKIDAECKENTCEAVAL